MRMTTTSGISLDPTVTSKMDKMIRWLGSVIKIMLKTMRSRTNGKSSNMCIMSFARTPFCSECLKSKALEFRMVVKESSQAILRITLYIIDGR